METSEGGRPRGRGDIGEDTLEKEDDGRKGVKRGDRAESFESDMGFCVVEAFGVKDNLAVTLSALDDSKNG